MSIDRVIVTSRNPVKIEATQIAFVTLFPDKQFSFHGISVSSGVSDQPKTSQETYQGAFNRVEQAQVIESEADFWVGLEGGIEQDPHGMQSFCWIIVQSRQGLVGKSKTACFYLPDRIAQLIREGKELGQADDIVFNMSNSKQEQGAIGILTHGITNRTKFYTEAIILALIPFKNGELY